MFAFSGEYEHSIDGKARLIIPAKFRPALEAGYYVTKGLDGCLWLFPLATWTEMSDKLQTSSITQEGARKLDRMLYAGTDDTLDGQGRLLVPTNLRSYAELALNGPVVVVGVKNRIELWEPGRWATVNSLVAEDSEFAEQLAGLGI